MACSKEVEEVVAMACGDELVAGNTSCDDVVVQCDDVVEVAERYVCEVEAAVDLHVYGKAVAELRAYGKVEAELRAYGKALVA